MKFSHGIRCAGLASCVLFLFVAGTAWGMGKKPKHTRSAIAQGRPGGDMPPEASLGKWVGKFRSLQPLHLFSGFGDIEAETYRQSDFVLGTCAMSSHRDAFRQGNIEATIDAKGNLIWKVSFGDGSYIGNFKGRLIGSVYKGTYTAWGPFYSDFGWFKIERVSR